MLIVQDRVTTITALKGVVSTTIVTSTRDRIAHHLSRHNLSNTYIENRKMQSFEQR